MPLAFAIMASANTHKTLSTAWNVKLQYSLT